MEDGSCLFVLGSLSVLGLVTVALTKLIFGRSAPVSNAVTRFERANNRDVESWVERGLKDEDGNLTVKGIAFLDGLDGDFDGRFDGPSWP